MARAGILMLQTRFPRPVGDVGNAATWPFSVQYKVVEGTSAEAIVRRLDPARFEKPFVEGARELEAAGVEFISTGCGFLVLLQDRLQAAVGVPVFSSSLLQVPWLLSILREDKKVGIMTFESTSLSPAHLAAAKIDASRVAIRGLEGTPFHTTIIDDLESLDLERARNDHVAAARSLARENPEVAALVLECTNMPPYADAIRAATRLPVYDLTTYLRWVSSGMRPVYESR